MPLLAVVTLPYTTGLPKDVAVNTFSFGGTAEDIPAYAGLLESFYNDVPTGGSNAIAYYLSGVISRATNQCTVEWYDRNDPIPRVPHETERFTLGTTPSSDNLPLEVAACVSFQGTRQSGMPQARRRGRVFIGPLKDTVLTTGPAIVPRLHSAFIAVLNGAASDLQAAAWAALPGTGWSVYSRVGASSASVWSGWVDNDPDTQRRRSAEASTRTAWSNLT